MRIEPEFYDATYAGLENSPLMRSLWSEAMAEQYPVEAEPFSSCSWWLLGHLVAALRLRPGGLLVDLGCGRGGPGLWLARALSARLIGIDYSGVAIQLARRRSRTFPGVHGEFRQTTFDTTNLSSGCADAVVSIDALSFARSRPAALREVHRILAPGAVAAITAIERENLENDWRRIAASTDLYIENAIFNPHHDSHWNQLYALWLAHEPALRRELGPRAADNLLGEARECTGLPDGGRPMLLVMRRG